ncbi:23S rRNA (uracil(747)-C(5))-methyltransferase RlmC [Mergibacter septicus]|uniref:23S rRNA (uracil(747)-C(5))-methyltransferase RlmC n=1 Tax=Mergibacter septicus TaxID=221402 RepID=A0A8D4LMT5_9PAST|nr:23S rRNA (uracil(747)-C(5))-methyltransferase RlmC [Mergibacter septicus]AWX14748.1 23S rRNA (uracil(747)-C(5))-methyltransferase RlmC [Mergibacter septicus]QDJ13999.1 23S rRNA (uracil(747)-C(5))-methyltransferase RlmC [Mergibacter septicus]UTU48552.1 23S rRNA (uracil(747)-C(5))-methyltransferase RlmC [Mergibacter septicus]WMR95819.1 23S rRNA (uracil(747)-C(5))-methyltransferase RlmC [Mergibacter septicus]
MPAFQPECYHYQQGKCRSCHWINLDYAQQLQQKQSDLKQQIKASITPQTQWLAPYHSPLIAMRNKAKMAVSGTVERPILGIINDPKDPTSAVDLSDCLLYPPIFQDILTKLKRLIGRAGLVPYNTAKKKGELKYILLTQSQDSGNFMLRFVLRSEIKLDLLQRELPQFLHQLPQITLVTANIQPIHAAILEGEKEIFLTKQQYLAENFNHIPLFIRPQGFFQTNPSVAAALYHTAQQWIKTLPIYQIWDLFCGVGGFGLHCKVARENYLDSLGQTRIIPLTGIEISPAAITAAQRSVATLKLSQVDFRALDATTYQANTKPDLVIVNPPRRGIGQELCAYLNQLSPNYLLYSSCNAVTMGKDLAQLNGYQLEKIQLFDMFPHTSHYEVIALLSKLDTNNH